MLQREQRWPVREAPRSQPISCGIDCAFVAALARSDARVTIRRLPFIFRRIYLYPPTIVRGKPDESCAHLSNHLCSDRQAKTLAMKPQLTTIPRKIRNLAASRLLCIPFGNSLGVK